LESDKRGTVDPTRDAIFAGRERHSSSRFHSLGYPQRCIRTPEFLYIRNFRPERWPAGAPRKFGNGSYAKAADVIAGKLGPPHGGYHDIDACPTLSFLIEHRDDAEISQFFHWSVDKRPAEELFDIRTDPGCLKNLADDPDHKAVKHKLAARLTNYLEQTHDARLDPNGGDIWETYPRYSGLRWFPTPEWAKQHPERVPKQEWLEKRRPR